MELWTDERIERAKALYFEGKSAGQIAQALGGTTRNAVIGKALRGKWMRAAFAPAPVRGRAPLRPERIRLAEEKRALAVAVAKPTARPVRPPTMPMPAEPPVTGEGVGFFDLRDRHCRFPLWPHAAKPVAAEQRYCGKRVRAEGESWCEACAARVNAPLRPLASAQRPSQLRR